MRSTSPHPVIPSNSIPSIRLILSLCMNGQQVIGSMRVGWYVCHPPNWQRSQCQTIYRTTALSHNTQYTIQYQTIYHHITTHCATIHTDTRELPTFQNNKGETKHHKNHKHMTWKILKARLEKMHRNRTNNFLPFWGLGHGCARDKKFLRHPTCRLQLCHF